MRWTPILVIASVVFCAGVAFAQAPAPRRDQAPSVPSRPPQAIVIDADTITYDAAQQIVTAQGNVRATLPRYRLFADAARYDLRAEVVTATGRVRLVDALGQELRGRALTYNTRTEEGFLTPVEGVLQRRVYVQGDRLDAAPARFIVHNVTLTTCDPARPLYRVVAKRIEIIPDEEVVAHDATIYLGARRLVTLRQYVISLRPGEEGTRVPTFGVTRADGLWVGYKLPVGFEGGLGLIDFKVGWKSGPMALVTLTKREPTLVITARAGRTQTSDARAAFDLLRYDVAEIGVATRPAPIGGTPLSWTASATTGWYSEQFGAQALKVGGSIDVGASGVPLAPRWSYAVNARVAAAGYTTGTRRTVLSYGASLTHRLDPQTTVSVGYFHATVRGLSPFIAVDREEPADTVSLHVARIVPHRYRVAAGVSYNRALNEPRVNATIFTIVSPRLELGVRADYNLRVGIFEDLVFTARIVCDCIDAVLRYNAARGYVALEFGLMDFPPRSEPFVPRPAPPAPPLPES